MKSIWIRGISDGSLATVFFIKILFCFIAVTTEAENAYQLQQIMETFNR